MAEEKIFQGKEAEIFQVGVVVKDVDKTVEYLSSLGMGPFSIRTNTHPAARVHGEKVSYEVKIALAMQGPVQLELIEYKRGTTIHKEFLDEHGEGLHHVLFQVRDLDATLEKFAKRGIKPLLLDRFVGGGGLAYMDTGKPGGIIMEIVQRPPHYDPKVGAKFVED